MSQFIGASLADTSAAAAILHPPRFSIIARPLVRASSSSLPRNVRFAGARSQPRACGLRRRRRLVIADGRRATSARAPAQTAIDILHLALLLASLKKSHPPLLQSAQRLREMRAREHATNRRDGGRSRSSSGGGGGGGGGGDVKYNKKTLASRNSTNYSQLSAARQL